MSEKSMYGGSGYNWRIDAPGAGGAESLLRRIDKVAVLVASGLTEEARSATRWADWRSDLDLDGIPEEVLQQVQAHLERANRALEAGSDGATEASDALEAARQVIIG